MSASKKSTIISESTKGASASSKESSTSVSSKGASVASKDGIDSKKNALKRSAEEVSSLRDWKPFNHQVFITKGEGLLRENVAIKTGELKDVFFILGTCADHKVVVLQVWGTNAKMIADLFKMFALPDNVPTLWIVPLPTAKGLCFREGQANEYQKKSYGAAFTLSLEYGKNDSAPYSGRMSVDAFPSEFDWDGGDFGVDGERIPHYTEWGRPSVDATHGTDERDVPFGYIPPKRTYDEASPMKSRRTSAASSRVRLSEPTDLSLDDEE